MICFSQIKRDAQFPFDLNEDLLDELPKMPKNMIFLSGLFGLLMLCSTCHAQTVAPVQRPLADATSDNFGIVVNQTTTLNGHEFYRSFTDYWREKPDYERYSLVIVERPSKRFGNQVLVQMGQKMLFNGALPTKIDALRRYGGEAVEKAYANILSLALRQPGMREDDIAEDEL